MSLNGGHRPHEASHACKKHLHPAITSISARSAGVAVPTTSASKRDNQARAVNREVRGAVRSLAAWRLSSVLLRCCVLCAADLPISLRAMWLQSRRVRLTSLCAVATAMLATCALDVTAQPLRASERAAVIDVYRAWNGPYWYGKTSRFGRPFTPWPINNASADPCAPPTWDGILCGVAPDGQTSVIT